MAPYLQMFALLLFNFLCSFLYCEGALAEPTTASSSASDGTCESCKMHSITLGEWPDEHFLEVSFDKQACALSEELCTWDQIALFLNSVATHNDSHHLYNEEMQQYISRKLVNDPTSSAWFPSHCLIYQVQPEHYGETANVSLETARRYCNWRETLDWWSRQSQAHGEGKLLHESHHELTDYFEKLQLWPMPEESPSIIKSCYDGIMEQSTEVGSYWFAPDGHSITKVTSSALYHLPTGEEWNNWTAQNPTALSTPGEAEWRDDDVNMEGVLLSTFLAGIRLA